MTRRTLVLAGLLLGATLAGACPHLPSVLCGRLLAADGTVHRRQWRCIVPMWNAASYRRWS